MRVSSSSIYGNAANAITQRQTELAKTGAQISSGLRLTNAADDPVAAARLIALEGSKSRNDIITAGEISARNALSQVESTLAGVNDVYSDIRSLLVQAGNAALSDSDRASVATELSARRDTLLGLANSRDADGRYLFSGYRESETPFVSGASGIEYRGDAGRRNVQVGLSRMMTVSASGADLFTRVSSGNGVFATAAGDTNAGSGRISLGNVSDAGALDGKTYRLAFHVSGGVTTYDVLDADGNAVSSAQPYTEGSDIVVAGMRVQVSGAPAEGDSFTLAPASARSVFDALDEIVSLLKTPVSDAASRSALSTGLAAGLAQLDTVSERAILARADAGSALKELDTLSVANSARDEQLQKQISELKDLDYAKATTELVQRQMVLQAAQQAYSRILGKSIFDFL